MASKKCISCHTQKDSLNVFTYPNQFALRIDHPERNPIFMAPLSKNEGGSGKCGAIVFKNKKDKDYKKLMATFEQLEKDLNLRPRLDMFSDTEEMTCMPESRTYLIGDYSNSKVSLYSDIFGNVWSYPVPGVYDCWMRPNGNTMICDWGNGISEIKALEVTPDKKIVWQLTNPAFKGISSIQVVSSNVFQKSLLEVV